MENITTPQVISKPFCANGDKNTIPSAATGSQLASLEEGFPEITEKPIAQGGIPPERKDFNGAMNLNSQFYFAFQNGWWPTFSADVSTAIGGYPLGAVLWWFPETGDYAGMAVPLKSLVANNTYNFNTNESYIGVYWKPLYKNPNALPIGTVFMHQSSNASDVPGGLPLFTGETLTGVDEMYPDFYAWVANHSELQISAADYETALTTYGECPKYVIDTTNKTIRLPLLKNYVKFANTTDGITQSEAGLPNITGDIDIGGAGFSGASATSALQRNSSSTGTGQGGSGPAFGLAFDASKSNSVYGNSDTNTPAHTTLYPWVCAYNSAAPASVAQAAQFQAALSSKVDLASGVNQADVDYVVERGGSGTEWCEIWKSGRIRQGGRSNTVSGGSTVSVTFLKEMSNTDYTISFAPIGNYTAQGEANDCVSAYNTTGMTFTSGHIANVVFSWVIEGE